MLRSVYPEIPEDQDGLRALDTALMAVTNGAASPFAAGLWLEGVNFAMGAGVAAGETAVKAVRAGDTSDAANAFA